MQGKKRTLQKSKPKVTLKVSAKRNPSQKSVQRASPKASSLVSRKGPTRSSRGSNSTVQPSRRTYDLKYVSSLKLSSGATGDYSIAYPIVSNNAFAVDSAAPSPFTTTPGFSIGSIAYSSYRVHSYRGKIVFSSDSASAGSSLPVVTTVCHSNSALGASAGGTTGIDVLQFAALRPGFNTIKQMSGGLGGPSTCTHSFSHSISSITGESTMQPGYKAATNAGPSISSYIVFGVESQAVGVTTITAVLVELTMRVEFLDYIDTLTSLFLDGIAGQSLKFRCGGCAQLATMEFNRCTCGQEDVCTTCRCYLPCCDARPSVRCTRVKVLVPVRSPLDRQGSNKSLKPKVTFKVFGSKDPIPLILKSSGECIVSYVTLDGDKDNANSSIRSLAQGL
jgi:hypothetical protein